MKTALRVALILLLLAGGCALLMHLTQTPEQAYFPIPAGTEKIHPTLPIHLGVVELDDEGQLYEGGQEKQLEPILKLLRERPTFLVLFIHGWHNDTSGKTLDLSRFRSALATNWDGSTDPAMVQVVGVFVGWRGTSSRVPGLRHLTYGDRYRTATRIAASPGSRDVFDQLIQATRTHTYGTRVLLTGHSMGGAILEGIYASQLESILAQDQAADGNWCYRNHARLADSVLLVNSASDWRESEPRVATFSRAYAAMFPEGKEYTLTNLERPVVTYLTSVTDSATSHVHGIGQGVIMLRGWGQAVGQRREMWTHRPQIVTARELLPGNEAGALKVTSDNYRDMFYFHPSGTRGYAFVKYSADVSKSKDDAEREVLEAFAKPCVIAGKSYRRRSTDRHPVWSAAVVPDVVDGHNDVWDSKMRLLVTRFGQFTRLSPPAADDRGEIGPLIKDLARADGWGGQIGNISKGERLRSQARVSLERRTVRDPDHIIKWLLETRAEWLQLEPRGTEGFNFTRGIQEIDFLLKTFGVPIPIPIQAPAPAPAPAPQSPTGTPP
jgi:hypothetical protein